MKLSQKVIKSGTNMQSSMTIYDHVMLRFHLYNISENANIKIFLLRLEMFWASRSLNVHQSDQQLYVCDPVLHPSINMQNKEKRPTEQEITEEI